MQNLQNLANLSALGVNTTGQKQMISHLKNLVNANGGVYFPLSETSGSVAEATNPALALGRELVINGDFADWTGVPTADEPDGWAVSGEDGSNFYTEDANGVRCVSDGSSVTISQVILEVGKSYTVTATVHSHVSGSLRIGDAVNFQVIVPNAVGVFTTEWVAGSSTFQITRGSGGNDLVLKSITIKQTTIAASTDFPGSEELTDGDMEAVDTSAWSAGGDPVLSKETTNPHGGSRVLRVTWGSSSSPDARQTIITVGKRYRVIGYARGDGTYLPAIKASTTLWTGTTSTSWQEFDLEFTATGTIIQASSNLGGAGYVEFDNLSVTEVNPFNGDTTGATVGQPGIGDGLTSYTFDGNNDYVDVYSAELNSAFNPSAGTLLAWAKVSDWEDGAVGLILRVESAATNVIQIKKSSINNRLDYVYEANNVNEAIAQTGVSTTNYFLTAITWDTLADGGNGEMKAYFNGVQEGSTLAIGGTWVGNLISTSVVIGAQNTVPNSIWDGSICHTALLRQALSATEIKQIAQIGGVA